MRFMQVDVKKPNIIDTSTQWDTITEQLIRGENLQWDL